MKELIYPWQLKQWEQLQQAASVQRLPHALILTGLAGIGKRIFADALVRLLLCQTPDRLVQEKVCDCHSCHLIARRSHPDAVWIEPEKLGHAIKVDQVRDINQFVNQSSMGDMNRAVVIYPADAMNINAANALLKTLEEPSQRAFLILVCDQAGRLPATILSRCQRVHFPRPDNAQAMVWLQQVSQLNNTDADLCLRLTHGAPCAASALLQDNSIEFRRQTISQLSDIGKRVMSPLQVASGIKEANYRPFVDVMLSWLLDLLKLQMGADTDDIVNIDYLTELSALKDKTQIKQNLQVAGQLQDLMRAVHASLNLNKQLMIENVLVHWVRGIAGSAAA